MNRPNFEAQVAALETRVVAWRRHMHENAEISFEEYQTTDYIEAELRKLGVTQIERPTKTGLIAHICGTKAGKPAVLGVRADIDALPMREAEGLSFRSKNEGAMHACGHDGHAAMLLGLAALLNGAKESFCGEARLFFQHAEELPPGGAIEMVRAGAAKGVEGMLALHLSSNFDTGVFGVKSGVLTSAVDRFDVTVYGKGGHSAFPEQCCDPVLTACELVTALQSVVSRKLAAMEPAAVSVCSIHAGTAYNIIPDEAKILVSVRSFGTKTRQTIEREAKRISEGVCAANGCTCLLNWLAGYPSVINDDTLTREASEAILARFGKASYLEIGCIIPGEDFQYFCADCPGFFAELGSRSIEKGTDKPHHSPEYQLDEDALIYGIQFEFDMARRLLDGTRRNFGGEA